MTDYYLTIGVISLCIGALAVTVDYLSKRWIAHLQCKLNPPKEQP